MISVNVSVTNDQITPLLKKQAKDLQNYPTDAEDKFRSLTPIRSGNARRHTNLTSNQMINADYPYAVRLDEGLSKQAPQGMTVPFEIWVKAKLKQIFGK
tara:strand:+ start:6648 stop:6944 length:297 start_codon:yes stop_codon:yes gene_type:complete